MAKIEVSVFDRSGRYWDPFFKALLQALVTQALGINRNTEQIAYSYKKYVGRPMPGSDVIIEISSPPHLSAKVDRAVESLGKIPSLRVYQLPNKK